MDAKVYLGEKDFSEDGDMSDNRNPVVDAWFEKYDNPQKDLVQAVRALILDTDPRITEVIKWQAPTFVCRSNLASFYPKSAKHVSLIFHIGASLSDRSGVIEGEGDTSRVLRVLDHDDLDGKADALRGLIANWIASKADCLRNNKAELEFG